MSFTKFRFVRALLAAGAVGGSLGVSAPAAAAPTLWQFTSATCVANCSPSRTVSKTFASLTVGGPNVGVTAWSNVAGNNDQLGDGSSGPSLVGLYGGSGLGVTHGDGETTSAPNHGLDNRGKYELLLFDLGDVPVQLTNVSLGYLNGDSDISVLAYTGTGAPTMTGLLYSAATQNLTSNGWAHVGNYDVDITDPSAPYEQSIVTAIASRFWIVAALNEVFPGCATDPPGTTTSTCNDDPNASPDYVKVLGLGGERRIPAPAVLVLLVAALPALLLRRRRRA